jgi:phosphoribosylformimino-5-aminoimidazole carboxamide ribotide isomerase
MIVYPAIDLRDGRCVRLVEGDFARETRYDADPTEAARRWQDAGATWLHVVDLDGARAGMPQNVEAITRIRAAVDIPIQLGGGLRSPEAVESAFDAGIDRVILGTAAVEDPDFVADMVETWGDCIAVALDARDGLLATEAWLGQSAVKATDAASSLAASGIAQFIFTDIRRDGSLQGPNLGALQELVQAIDADVIASGGVSSLADIQAVAAIGASGAIVGRALYDGRLDLAAAIAAAELAGAQR